MINSIRFTVMFAIFALLMIAHDLVYGECSNSYIEDRTLKIYAYTEDGMLIGKGSATYLADGYFLTAYHVAQYEDNLSFVGSYGLVEDGIDLSRTDFHNRHDDQFIIRADNPSAILIPDMTRSDLLSEYSEQDTTLIGYPGSHVSVSFSPGYSIPLPMTRGVLQPFLTGSAWSHNLEVSTSSIFKGMSGGGSWVCEDNSWKLAGSISFSTYGTEFSTSGWFFSTPFILESEILD